MRILSAWVSASFEYLDWSHGTHAALVNKTANHAFQKQIQRRVRPVTKALKAVACWQTTEFHRVLKRALAFVLLWPRQTRLVCGVSQQLSYMMMVPVLAAACILTDTELDMMYATPLHASDVVRSFGSFLGAVLFVSNRTMRNMRTDERQRTITCERVRIHVVGKNDAILPYKGPATERAVGVVDGILRSGVHPYGDRRRWFVNVFDPSMDTDVQVWSGLTADEKSVLRYLDSKP